MKNYFATILAVLGLSLVSVPSMALSLPSEPTSSAPTPKASPAPASLTVNDFLALSPKKIHEITGQKMSFTEKLAFRYAQRKLRREVRQHPEVGAMAAPDLIDDSDFNIGGFVLGLLIPVLGVVIAYLIGDRDVIKWAWLGFAAFAIFFLIFVVIL